MSSFRFISRILPIALGALAFASLGFGQFESGTVLGTVHDPSGGSVANAQVTLLNKNTGVAQGTHTEQNGDYQFVDVHLGSYSVKVEAPGFRTATTDPFDLTVNARQRVDIALQLGQTSQNVTVSGAAELLETDNSSRGQVINPKRNRRSATQRPLVCGPDAAGAGGCEIAARKSNAIPAAMHRST